MCGGGGGGVPEYETISGIAPAPASIGGQSSVMKS